MCLDIITAPPEQHWGIGYVVRMLDKRVQPQSVFWNKKFTYTLNEQYRANMVPIVFGDSCYISGWHIFTNREEAYRYMCNRCGTYKMTVIPVAYWRAHTRGMDGGYGPVVIAESIIHLAKKSQIWSVSVHKDSISWYDAAGSQKIDFLEWHTWCDKNKVEIVNVPEPIRF